jgi:glucose 1-dehydrogenase
MKAITAEPHVAGSARLEDVREPDLHEGSVLVEAIAVGVEPDIIVECTGVGQVIVDALRTASAGGVVCLTGVGSGGRTTGLPAADIASAMVLKNNVIVGSVNAGKRHWYKAGEALARADAAWLSQLVTRQERPEDFSKALNRQPDDIRVVVQFAEA